MRALVIGVAALAALWASYWFVGHRQVETRARAALADLEARGWTAGYATLDTRGFPNRFDTTVTGLTLADPEGRVSWSAPQVELLMLSYQPNRAILAFPPEQTVEVMGRPIDVAAEGMRASGAVRLRGGFPLDRATLESGPLRLTAEGWGAAMDRLLVAVRQSGAAPSDYDLWIEAANLAPEGGGPGLDLVRLDARLLLDRPLAAGLAGAPLPRRLTIDEARLSRGPMALVATGELAPDADGVLEGQVTLAVEDWRGMLALAQEAGLLDEGRRALLERALDSAAKGADRIEIPVTFAGGRVSALGLPLLDAPRLR